MTRTLALTVVALGATSCVTAHVTTPSPAPTGAPVRQGGTALRLDFADLFTTSGDQPGPSTKARAAVGQRIRLKGYMAQMEVPPRHGFFLTRHPVSCDEAGGGTADLPADAVLVQADLREQDGTVPFIQGPLEVIGVLELGYRSDADGQVSHIRIRVSPRVATALVAPRSSSSSGGKP